MSALRSPPRKSSQDHGRQALHPRLGHDSRRARRSPVRAPGVHRPHQHRGLRQHPPGLHQPRLQPRERQPRAAPVVGDHRGTLLRLPPAEPGRRTEEDAGAGQGRVPGPLWERLERHRAPRRGTRGDAREDGGAACERGGRRQGRDERDGGDVEAESGAVRAAPLCAVCGAGFLDARGDRTQRGRELRHCSGVLPVPGKETLYR
mmetsp:Transcript_24298/g.54315  ORF Transcript_24298/g.54315 Transcript_24298/m.54315 type:complete len:204 (+) Transcript_24298:1428-2039(+)